MTRQELKSFLLASLDNAKEGSAGRQIVCRCHLPGCTDMKQHLYIGSFENSDEPVFYNCFKCGNSGVVGQKFFESYNGINLDPQTIKELSSANKGSSYRVYSRTGDTVYNIRCINNDSPVTRKKLEYVNKRLGTDLTIQDCNNLKIVLNLYDILQNNGIKYTTRSQLDSDMLNNYFIGFLGRANSVIAMRNLLFDKNRPERLEKLPKNLRSKYVNYNIFQNVVANDYYIIPTQLDVSEHVSIHVAEGSFDILGIFNSSPKKYNSIYIAGKGKAYCSIVEFLIVNYGITKGDVHFYVDKDVPNYKIEDAVKYLSPFRFSFYLHRNTYQNEKDFGVPVQRIIDSSICLRRIGG